MGKFQHVSWRQATKVALPSGFNWILTDSNSFKGGLWLELAEVYLDALITQPLGTLGKGAHLLLSSKSPPSAMVTATRDTRRTQDYVTACIWILSGSRDCFPRFISYFLSPQHCYAWVPHEAYSKKHQASKDANCCDLSKDSPFTSLEA